MNYDNGEVLQGLNESWTFMGANAMEWCCGVVVFFLISLFAESPARAMPFMLLGWVTTTTSLASLRKTFPDEERGLRNALAVACGVKPPSIPEPASLQPVWSGCPLREPEPDSRFVQLGLSEMFPSFRRDMTEADLTEETMRGGDGRQSA